MSLSLEDIFRPCTCHRVRGKLDELLTALSDTRYVALVIGDEALNSSVPVFIKCPLCNSTGQVPTSNGRELLDALKVYLPFEPKKPDEDLPL